MSKLSDYNQSALNWHVCSHPQTSQTGSLLLSLPLQPSETSSPFFLGGGEGSGTSGATQRCKAAQWDWKIFSFSLSNGNKLFFQSCNCHQSCCRTIADIEEIIMREWKVTEGNRIVPARPIPLCVCYNLWTWAYTYICPHLNPIQAMKVSICQGL